MADAEIYVENEQDVLPFLPEYEQVIVTVIETVLEQEEFVHPCEVSVLITDDVRIRLLNAEHRGKDAATDVLSFPMLAFDDMGELVSVPHEPLAGALLLGDIVISLERAAQQADEFGHSLAREIGFLTAHSVLHLLGYDHEWGEKERQIMREKEERTLGLIGLVR